MDNTRLPPLHTPGEVALRAKLRAARRANNVAAVVANGYGEMIDAAQADPSRAGEIPVDAVKEMLADVIAALGGVADPGAFHLLGEAAIAATVSIGEIVTMPLEDR